MSDITSKTSTNYFAVKDKEALEKIASALVTCGMDTVTLLRQTADGTVRYRICTEDEIIGMNPDPSKEIGDYYTAGGEHLIENEYGSLSYEDGTPYDGSKASPKTYNPKPDEMWTAFVKEIQSVLADGEACIVTQIFNEKLRYIGGTSCIITQDREEWVDIWKAATAKAREMLGNKDWETQSDY